MFCATGTVFAYVGFCCLASGFVLVARAGVQVCRCYSCRKVFMGFMQELKLLIDGVSGSRQNAHIETKRPTGRK